jgi:hypothetical protein
MIQYSYSGHMIASLVHTKTDNLLAQFSFHQLITEPTYVTERSSSVRPSVSK